MFTLAFLLVQTQSKILLTEECDFKCWIRKLNISIPDFNSTSKGFTFYLNDLFIHGIDISTISADFYPNPEVIEKGIQIRAKVSADIQGHFAVSASFLPRTGAYLDADAKGVDFHIALEFNKGDDGLITAVVVPSGTCSIKMDSLTAEIKTDSSLLQPIISVIKPILIPIIKNNIGSMVCGSINDALSTYITQAFDEANKVIRPYLNGSLPITIPISPDMSDVRTFKVIDMLRFVLTNFTGVGGPLNLNDLVNRFTKDTGIISLASVVGYFGIEMPLTFNIPIIDLNADINFSIVDLKFSGMNTWHDFTFLDPISPFKLDTHTGMDNLGINMSFGINVSVDGKIITTGDSVLHEDGDLDLLMNNNDMQLQLQLAIPEGAGESYTSTMALSPSCIEGLLSPKGTGMTYINFNTTIGYIDIDSETQSMEVEIRQFINNIVDLFVTNYKPVIPYFLNGFINQYGVGLINNMLQESLAKANCTYEEDPPYEDIQVTVTLFVAIGAVALTLIFLGITIWLDRRNKAANIVEADPALIMTPKLPRFIRILMIFLIFANAALFISSNTGLGASVFIKLFIGDRVVEMPSMFDFGLINSIIDMWNAEAYALSVLIAVMSCLWPYTKLLLMLFAWILPGKALSKQRREKLLEMLDALGKWSLVDSFVMILMLVAFHVTIGFPVMSPKVDDSVKINIFVYPAYGFVTLMLGTVISLALSHILLALDRYVDDSLDEGPEEPKQFISLYKFVPKAWQAFAVAILIFGTGALLVCGLCFNSFEFQFVGLAGWAMNLLDTRYKNEYSVIKLGLDVPASAQFPNSFVVRFTQVLYFLITIVLPAIHIICLAVVWLCPMTRKAQKGLYVACGVLYAWSCLDVFVISIIAAVMEISQLAMFMVGDKCELIDPLVKMFFADEPLIKGHETCFEVITVLQSGSWMLFAAAIFHNVVTIVVNRLARHAIDERGSSMSSGILFPSTDPLLSSQRDAL